MTNQRILVVDDEIQMLAAIKESLRRCEYDVVTASNPVEALNRFAENHFSLVITDMKMPMMSGIELLRNVKKEKPAVPVIMVTAYGTIDTAIQAMREGAFDYIIKPFEESALKARIENLLRQRKRLHEHFKTLGFFIEEEIINPVDHKFIQQTISLINEYIAYTNFSVEMLAADLAVSRSLLHKKLMALIGQSPSDLIRRIRLNKAAKLIEHKSGNISEIALEVGFNSPSYFAKCFQKQFGFNPSRYHQNSKKQN